jgi:hypothetical protein
VVGCGDGGRRGWGKARLEAEVGTTWAAIRADIEGWHEEATSPPGGLLAEPQLPRTSAAIQRIRYLLAQQRTRRVRAANADDPAIEAPYREAERVLAAAGQRLREAYDNVLAEAERLPTPPRGFDLDRPNRLAAAAERSLAGTPHLAPVLARARTLDARWRADADDTMAVHQDLYDRLRAEADAAWPAILAATGARADFDPDAPPGPARAVLLRGVYNRSGWDFADYDFAMRFAGVPIGGHYDPHVLRALENAWYGLKLDVDDRTPWDVIAVVEGPGKIGEHTIVTIRDRDTGLEIGTREEWHQVDCIRLRIIALHAGPVAVGPTTR